MPTNFFRSVQTAFNKCDLLIVIGTSLQVQPFAGLIDRVNNNCPRVLVNREIVGQRQHNNNNFIINKLKHKLKQLLSSNNDDNQHSINSQQSQIQHIIDQLASNDYDDKQGFEFHNGRDYLMLGDCDSEIEKLAKALGYHNDIIKQIEQFKQNNNTMPTITSDSKQLQQSNDTIHNDNTTTNNNNEINKGAEFANKIAHDL